MRNDRIAWASGDSINVYEDGEWSTVPSLYEGSDHIMLVLASDGALWALNRPTPKTRASWVKYEGGVPVHETGQGTLIVDSWGDLLLGIEKDETDSTQIVVRRRVDDG